MIIRNCSYSDILNALSIANFKFGCNLQFRRLECLTKHRLTHRVTLRVRDSRGPGAGIGFSGRRTVSACWHAHGTFFDSLPYGANIETGRFSMLAPGAGWIDYNVGSIMRPYYASDACKCE